MSGISERNPYVGPRSIQRGEPLYGRSKEVQELYSVPVGGGAITKLNGTLTTGGDVTEIGISPDSSTVVYRANQETSGTFELYSVPIGGGTAVKLNGALTVGGSVGRIVHIKETKTTGSRGEELIEAILTLESGKTRVEVLRDRISEVRSGAPEGETK